MSPVVYEFPEINTRLEGTVVKMEGEYRYFPQSYIHNWDGGDLEERKSVSITDGRITERDREIIDEWTRDNISGDGFGDHE